MSTQPDPNAPAEETPGSPLRTAILNHVVTTVLIVSSVSFAIWSYFNFQAGDFFYEPSQQDESRTMQRYLVASQLHRFDFAAQAYEAIHNAPPQSMEDLVAEGLILESDLTYPSPRITYSVTLEEDQAVVTAAVAQAPEEPEASEDEPEPEKKKRKKRRRRRRKKAPSE
jgi:hypothetical protein